ncbi:PEP-CTERM sorting domain-containing protein [Pontiellaceae bacterium B12219]|nr:PEP-CTERM sorting domain-containing protein [Pontiellaceae bacterium B12219]
MKKTLVMVLGVALVGASMADVVIDFKTTAPVFKPGGTQIPGDLLDVGAVAQLVWSASPLADYQTSNIDLSLGNGLQRDGEYILTTYVSAGPGGGVQAGSGTYGNDDVGGNDIHQGYFFGRIFQTTGAVNDYFIEFGIQNPELKTFVDTDPTSDYDTTMLSVSTDIAAYGTQVVPEPATLGLMGIAGLGMFLARKKTRR